MVLFTSYESRGQSKPRLIFSLINGPDILGPVNINAFSLKMHTFDSEKPRGDEPIKYVCMYVCMYFDAFRTSIHTNKLSVFIENASI